MRKLRIWLLNPYGPIPGEEWRDYRFTLAARALAARGHDVTWWTATFDHYTKRFRTDRYEEREADGFHVHLVPTPSYARNIGPARLRFERAYQKEVVARAWERPRPDVIVAADPPQFAGAAGRALSVHHDVPLVLDTLDLWPELFISSSPVALRPLVWLAVLPLFRMRKRNIARASVVIAVAETYRLAVENAGASRAVTIPVGVDLAGFLDHKPTERTRHLVAVYAGSLGEAYDVSTVIRAAARLQDPAKTVDFVIAGRGPAEDRLRDLAATLGAKNVKFAGSLDPVALLSLYAQADVGLMPYASGSTVVLPLKLFDYWAAGLPVLTSLGGEARTRIEDARAGVFYRSGNPESMVAALEALASDRDELRRMSERAAAAASEFDSARLYDRYAEEIEAVALR